MARPRRVLRGISEIRAFLRTNRRPIYFISPTPFNLLGIDRWVRNFFFVNWYDSFEGSHPRIFVPRQRPYREWKSMEEINNALLRHPEVEAFIHSKSRRGLAAFVMFDEETEDLAPRLGLRIIHPRASLRRSIDSKTNTVRLANEAGVPSVPNVLAPVRSWAELGRVARRGKLGDDLVIQSPYGDSGRTTYFIRDEADWRRYGEDIAGEPEVKVMRRIRNRAAAIEACITRHGTIVGPLMTDLTGFRELTPYKGGWCGNDLWPKALPEDQLRTARRMIQRLGDRLARAGYRGFLEVDVLVDLDSNQVYLGEINPRVSGASSLTNVTAGAYADLPLFCFHLLEYMNVDYEIDVDDINERWAEAATIDDWSQLIIKEPEDRVERLTSVPRTGIWKMEADGSIRFGRWANDWHSILDGSEAFFLRVLAPGDYRYKGADLGTLVTRSRMQTDRMNLTRRCRRWVAGVRGQYTGVPVGSEPEVFIPPPFKG
jgi:biotin carboxylase